MRVSTMTCLMYSARNTERKTSALEAAKRLHETGFECLDLFLCGLVRSQNASFSGEAWREEAEQLKAWAVEAGVCFHQSHLPYDPGAAYDPDDREFNALFHKMILRGLEISRILGVKHAVVHPFSAPGAARGEVSVHVQENLKRYEAALDLASRLGITLAFENMGADAMFGSRAEDLTALTEAIKDKKAAVCWDVGHGQLVYGDKNAEAIEKLGGRIVCLHVHDNKGVTDDHLPPFRGKIKWERVMAALKKAGYAGELNYEVSVNADVPDLLRNETARYCAKAGEFLVKMFEEG